MGAISRNWTRLRWGFIPLAASALIVGFLLHVGRSVHANPTPPPTVKEIKLGTARPGTLYAFTLAVKDPAQVQGSDAVLATVKDAQGVIDSKWLHTADLDFYLTLRPRAAGPVTVSLSSTTPAPEMSTSLRKILEAPVLKTEDGLTPGVIAAAPNGTWQTAQPFELGQTIYGSDDERPYAPSRNEDGYAAMVKGFQWFKFTFQGSQATPGLLRPQRHRSRCPARRGHLPAGQRRDATWSPSTTGEFVYQVEATQNYPGLYKFRTRILEPGQEYYVRVAGESPGLPTPYLPTTRVRLTPIRTSPCARAWTSWSTWATPGFPTRRAAAPSPCAPPCSTPRPSSASPATRPSSPRAAI